MPTWCKTVGVLWLLLLALALLLLASGGNAGVIAGTTPDNTQLDTGATTAAMEELQVSGGLGLTPPDEGPTPVGPQRSIHREYVWGIGGLLDELLVYYDADLDEHYPIQDASGDIVSVVLVDGFGGVSVGEELVYGPYGDVVHLAVHGAFARLDAGHKGLFADRLDASNLASPTLIPYGDTIYHNRNRVYHPGLGRFLQRDPNASAFTLLSGSHTGASVAAIAVAFDLSSVYGDGANLYQYLGSNPVSRFDPMGLSSWDPFEMVDDFLALRLGNVGAFLGKIGMGGRSAAIVGAQVLSMSPVPLASIVGDLALMALGEQTPVETLGMIALGVIPGGKLLAKLGPSLAKVGVAAWSMAIKYAQKGANFLWRAGRDFAPAAFGRIQNAGAALLSRAKGWLDDLRDAGLKACGCFSASTLVLTADGTKTIESIQLGDAVESMPDGLGGFFVDPDAASTAPAEIAGLVISLEDAAGRRFEVFVPDQYPFYSHEFGFVSAESLVPGQEVALEHGVAVVTRVTYDSDRRLVTGLIASSEVQR